MLKNNFDLCPACGGIGEVKIIKNLMQVGPYHLGKEVIEKCKFCSDKKPQKKPNQQAISGSITSKQAHSHNQLCSQY